MMTKVGTLMASFVLGSVALMGALGSARAADVKQFVLGQTTLKATDPNASIKSEGSRWDKDVKQVKLSVEGADVQITNVVLHWDNRKDDTLTDIGVVKSGGQTAAKDAPGMKGRLTSVTVQYKILGGAQAADLKVWGFDQRVVTPTGAPKVLAKDGAPETRPVTLNDAPARLMEGNKRAPSARLLNLQNVQFGTVRETDCMPSLQRARPEQP